MLRISGIVCYENADEVLQRVKTATVRCPSEIAMNLEQVETIDSSGLKVLLQGRRLCEEAGIGFRVDAVSACVERIMRMSGLANAFGMAATDIQVKPCPSRASIDKEAAGSWRTSEYIVRSEASLIGILRDKAAMIAKDAGAEGEILCDIKIAVGEALTNAYRHGSPYKGVNRITMRCLTCNNAFVVEIEDEGYPFDPSATSEPQPDEMRDHGMGLFLMRQAMDVVDIKSNCPGNIVRMTKWLKQE